MSSNSSELKPVPIDAASPVGGYCMMVDIVDSVRLKFDHPPETQDSWLSSYFKFVVMSQVLFKPSLQPLKMVGDLMMFWSSVKILTGFNSVALLQRAIDFQKKKTDAFLPTRIAIVKCQAVYELSYFGEMSDVQGPEIDLASRLLKHADRNEIVMNDAFYEDLKSAAADPTRNHQNYEGINSFRTIQGPWTKTIEGFPNPVSIFKYSLAVMKANTESLRR